MLGCVCVCDSFTLIFPLLPGAIQLWPQTQQNRSFVIKQRCPPAHGRLSLISSLHEGVPGRTSNWEWLTEAHGVLLRKGGSALLASLGISWDVLAAGEALASSRMGALLVHPPFNISPLGTPCVRALTEVLKIYK